MISVKDTLSIPTNGSRVRSAVHYHSLLTPILQRRFARAFLLAVAICFIIFVGRFGGVIYGVIPRLSTLVYLFGLTVAELLVFVTLKANLHGM